ncbi:MAG: PAS domain S-box protein [Desulfobacteraceae bacterium]|nr:MAG: PAS domain S-box protein [Desulfobacteraceae bacterium]
MLKRMLNIITAQTVINVVLPVGLTVILFVGAVFLLTLPAFEDSLIAEKRETIKELTNLTWELLNDFEQKVQKGELSRDRAKQLACETINHFRYGAEKKDYFWINDMHPRMVMHPYRPDLNGSDLTGFTDPEGNRLFVDFVKAVKTDGQGYVRYMWQWKDDPDHIVPKISFVKEFKPWGWIIGTGIYLEDVQARIDQLSKNLKILFSLILFIIVLLSFYTIRQAGQNEKKKALAEKALKSSEDRYRTILKIFEDGYFEVDLKGNMVFCNDAMSKMIGYPKEELMGMNNRRYMDEENAKHVYQTFNEVYRTGKLHKSIDWKLSRPDGTNRWIETSVTLIRDSENQPAGFRGVVRDISERKSAEEAMQQAKNRYQAIVEDMPAMICRFRPDYTLTFANENYCRYFHTTTEELIGKKLTHFIPEEDWHKVEKHYQSLTFNSPMKTYVQKAVSQTGEVRWREWTDRALFNNQGKITEYQSLGRDITDLKLAALEKETLEKQLRHSRKMESIGTLTGGIAHDFNNILSIILGNTEIALDDLSEWSPARRNLTEIRNATLRAKDVIQQLLSFSRKAEQLLQPIRIDTIIDGSLKLLRSSIPSNITIQKTVKEPIGIIMADPTQIHQIILNLCTNAFHAMENVKGRMDIELANTFIDESDLKNHPGLYAGNHVVLTVRDNGEGIEEGILEKIFDPYFTTKEVGKGTGMGLSVVHGIVKNYGGIIKVESRVHEGACFRIFFPAVNVECEEEEKSSVEIPKGNEKILFIDDEELIAQIAQKQLERLGYSVVTETDPLNALDTFRSTPDLFDLVITDMTMPQMSGEKLVQEITKIKPGMPIIICTGYNDKITEAVSQKIGARGLLMKPFGINELAVMIKNVINPP